MDRKRLSSDRKARCSRKSAPPRVLKYRSCWDGRSISICTCACNRAGAKRRFFSTLSTGVQWPGRQTMNLKVKDCLPATHCPATYRAATITERFPAATDRAATDRLETDLPANCRPATYHPATDRPATSARATYRAANVRERSPRAFFPQQL